MQGPRLAFDIGRARIGVAATDAHRIISSPKPFIARSDDESATITSLTEVVREVAPSRIYIGLPINLRNQATASTVDAVHLAKLLQLRIDIPIYLVDERLTTRMASQQLSSTGRNSRKQRQLIDSAAAVQILEYALNLEKSNREPGIAVNEYE